ncbi:MAG: phosphate transport system regulatory protein PhoU [Planctomycetota bacterium]|nr:MAG: phosphate transport system regulatory protein PhoU [Planctomycetota bacterium]
MSASHLHREIEKLKRGLLILAARVEEALRRAVRAVEKRNAALAREVILDDPRIDVMEVELEEECLKALALHQPVAGDLRFVVAVLKINNDLERIGDLAVNIAENACALADAPRAAVSFELGAMARKALALVRMSIESLVERDAALARKVLAGDDEVDDMNRRIFAAAREAMKRDPSSLDVFVRFLSVSRHLERVADHATNIAEDVIYLLEGEIVRHGGALRESGAAAAPFDGGE